MLCLFVGSKLVKYAKMECDMAHSTDYYVDDAKMRVHFFKENF